MLDTKLFKALRAGGLGHRAAALLAESSSRYYLGDDDLTDTSNVAQSLTLTLTPALLDIWEAKYTDSSVVGQALLLPLRAAAALTVSHQVQGETNFTPDGLYHFHAVKLADANGIPVAPDGVTKASTRASNVVSPASTGSGWTFAAAGADLTATQATAGLYLVTVSFHNDVRR